MAPSTAVLRPLSVDLEYAYLSAAGLLPLVVGRLVVLWLGVGWIVAARGVAVGAVGGAGCVGVLARVCVVLCLGAALFAGVAPFAGVEWLAVSVRAGQLRDEVVLI